MVKPRLALALGLLLCAAGCRPRQVREPAAPPQNTLMLPVWDIDVAEDVATNPGAYRGKTLIIRKAYLDPKRGIQIARGRATFALRGGGQVLMPADAVPAWLKRWTAAPLTIETRVHPPRRGLVDAASDPILTASFIDFTHPLELSAVAIDRAKDGTWLTAHIENYRGHPAAASLTLRFDTVDETRKIDAVKPGGSTQVRLKLFGAKEPAWAELPPEKRRLTLTFADGASMSVDPGQWLAEAQESRLDTSYSFIAPANAVVLLSNSSPKAELERFAALRLRAYLTRLTDANIEPREPKAAEPLPPKLPLLLVGSPGHNPAIAAVVGAAGLGERLGGLGAEGYLLKTLEHAGRPALLVAANTPRGVAHGVYGLLEHYNVRFTMFGARLPARGKFRLVSVDEAKVPLFARRRLVAVDRRPEGTARWSNWQWISMIDLAAKNRYNEVVLPLDGLDSTFRHRPGKSRDALFPFAIGAYLCLAEAQLAHQRGLRIIDGYARQRGLAVTYARRKADGKLYEAAPPSCVGRRAAADLPSKPIEWIDDPGNNLSLPRIDEAAAAAADLLGAKSALLAVPFGSSSRSRATFLAKLAWDKALTPKAYWRGWASTLCEGEAAERLAEAMLGIDKLDGDILAAVPEPLGQGPPLATPVRETDLASKWGELRARATDPATAKQLAALKAQARKLREISRRLEPLDSAVREALESVPPPWEAPAFESSSATERAAKLSRAFALFRGLIGSLAYAQEGALAYYAALAQPENALPRLHVAATKYDTARRTLKPILERVRGRSLEAVFARLDAQLAAQYELLYEWIGPVVDAIPAGRIPLPGSDAVVHLFRRRRTDIYVAHKLAGSEVVQLQLPASRARVIRRGQPTRAIHAEGGMFLISLDTAPAYIVSRRATWPGHGAP